MDTHVTPLDVTRLPATLPQCRTTLVIAGLLLVAFAAAAPYGGVKLPQYVSFNPTVQAIVFATDLITSVFLFAQFRISKSRAILALAVGYLYAALIVIPYTLAYPGSFTGLINAGPQSSAWLYYFWIDGIPVGAIAYALLIIADTGAKAVRRSVRSAIYLSLLLVIALVCGFTWITTSGIWLLPPMMDGDRYTYVVTAVCTPLSILIALIAIVLLWSIRQTILDYWLMLVMLSLLLNHVMADFLGGERYSLGFYASRGFTIVTSTLVLILLMQQLTDLYLRLASVNAVLERERNNRLMNIEAIVASIVHEIKQPLTAIAANGAATLALLARTPPDLVEAKSGLRDIIDDTHNANGALDAVRTLVQRVDQAREPIDMNDIAIEALQSMRGELMAHGITVRSEMITDMPLMRGNRNQLLQVVINLIHNAVEAMGTTRNQHRTLTVKTGLRGQTAVELLIEDSGPGIGQDHLDGIFDVFVTTKPHGMGLGLAICRTIVEKHDGELTAFSDGKTGASFKVILPIRSLIGSTAQAE